MDLAEIYRRTIDALDPADLIANAIERDPPVESSVEVIALGKAAHGMFAGASRALGDRIARSVVVGPGESDHPVPTQRSVACAQRLLGCARGVASDSRLIALISGGGSAMATLPPDGLSLDEVIEGITAVSRSGAPIGELNAVRKRLCQIKGGQLAAACPAPISTYVLSDVVGDDPATVASGPTVPDPTTLADAAAVLERCAPDSAAAQFVRAKLVSGAADTPMLPRVGDAVTVVAGVDRLAATAVDVASSLGYRTVAVGETVHADVGAVAAQLAWALRGAPAGAVVIAAGEPTIELPEGADGSGGRAHHLALLLALELGGDIPWRALIGGSDGIDGNTGAAGAIVSNETASALTAAGYDIADELRRCNSQPPLAAIGASFSPGPTGVNHCDLMLLVSG